MEELLARAVAAGARVTRAPAGTGPAMVAPAVVEGAEADAEIVREETFGPVLVVEEAADFEAALARVDAVPQGLAAAVFTRDDAEWERFRRTVRAGVLRRNSATAGAVGDLPFGGWKASGWGPAEHAEADREFFTRRQAWINTETKL
jgi:aldehyde dehydrogenase (NAD+)